MTLVNLIFPLNYGINQFTSCLNSTIVKDNLDALVNQVQEQNYTKIVLSKLREVSGKKTPGAYPSWHRFRGRLGPSWRAGLTHRSIQKNTTHILTYGQFKISIRPNPVHVFGLSNEAREPAQTQGGHAKSTALTTSIF